MSDAEEDDEVGELSGLTSPGALVKRGQRAFRTSVFVADNYPVKKGYLRKKASSGLFASLNPYQSRYFVAKNHYLVYCKSEETAQTCLATLDLAMVGKIEVINGSDFQVGNFYLKANSGREALEWVDDLQQRRKRILESRKVLKELELEDAKKESHAADRKKTAMDIAMQHLSKEKDGDKGAKKMGGKKSVVESPKKSIAGHFEKNDDEDSDDDAGALDGLLDGALWEIFSGNIPVNKLSPSPARDTVRLALAAKMQLEKSSMQSARSSIESKEKLMSEIRLTKDQPRDQLRLSAKVSVNKLVLNKVKLDNTSDGKLKCPPGVPMHIWTTIVNESHDLSHMNDECKYEVMAERAAEVAAVINNKPVISDRKVLKGDDGAGPENADETISFSISNDAIEEPTVAAKSNIVFTAPDGALEIPLPVSPLERVAVEAEKACVVDSFEKLITKLELENKYLKMVLRAKDTPSPFAQVLDAWNMEELMLESKLRTLEASELQSKKMLDEKKSESEEITSRLESALFCVSQLHDDEDDDEFGTVVDLTNKILEALVSMRSLKSSWAQESKTALDFYDNETKLWREERRKINLESSLLQNMILSNAGPATVVPPSQQDPRHAAEIVISTLCNKIEKLKSDLKYASVDHDYLTKTLYYKKQLGVL